MSTLHFNALVPPFDLGEGTATEQLEKANIRTYGADNTGVEAADKALKEALEESTIVYFPKGTYLFEEEHKVKGQVILYGDGQNISTLKTNQKTNCSIIAFQNAGAQIHDLKLEGPLTGCTGGNLLLFTEEVYEEAAIFFGGAIPKGYTEASKVTTYGGWNQIALSKCVGINIKDWIGTEVRNIGLLMSGERVPSLKPVNSVFLKDVTITGKEVVPENSIAIQSIAGEFLVFDAVDTEFCEVGFELTERTENCFFANSGFDAARGTAVVITGSSKFNMFNNIWANSVATGGGVIIGPWEQPCEHITFQNSFFSRLGTGEILNCTELWKEISETEYKALASKKGVWKEKTVYAAKDGVERSNTSPETFPPTGGGIRFYEALKATKAFNPHIIAGKFGLEATTTGFPFRWKTGISYAVADTVEGSGAQAGKFYKNIVATAVEPVTNAAFWTEITEVEFKEGDFQPVSPCNGVTIGGEAKAISIVGCHTHLVAGNGIHAERPNGETAQDTVLIANQLREYKGFGIRIGKNQANITGIANQAEALEGRGTFVNDQTANGFFVFNTGATEFLTATMSKPAVTPGLSAVENIQVKETTAYSNIRGQIISYKTKKETETKVKHNLNSATILSVTAYQYHNFNQRGAWKAATEYKTALGSGPSDTVSNGGKFFVCIKTMTAGEDKEPPNATFWTEITEAEYNGWTSGVAEFGKKMQLASKTVESYTVNSKSEITIKWSPELGAKEEIAILIQAA